MLQRKCVDETAYRGRGPISTEENEVQASIGDELVDQQPLLLLQADADEPDEVPVLQLGDQRELVLQLLHSLRRALRQPLHGYLVAIGENTLDEPKQQAL